MIDWIIAGIFVLQIGTTIRMAGRVRKSYEFIDAPNVAVDWVVSLLIIFFLGTLAWHSAMNALGRTP